MLPTYQNSEDLVKYWLSQFHFISSMHHVQYQLKHTAVNAPRARNLLQKILVQLPAIVTG